MIDRPQDAPPRPMDDLDRLAARSLAARQSAATPPQRRAIWPWLLVAALLAFVIGMLGSPWFEREVRSQLPPPLRDQPLSQSDPRFDGLEARVARLEAAQARPPSSGQPALPGAVAAPAPADPAFDARLAALEAQAQALQGSSAATATRIEQLAADIARTSGEAAAGDRQVRDLFLLSVARRMLDGGRALTVLEPALAARFRPADDAAVDALAAWSTVPQTRDSLAGRLEAMQAAGSVPVADDRSLWQRLRDRLSGLVTVRTEQASGLPADAAALPEAIAALKDDDLPRAIRRMQAAPPSEQRDTWLKDAQARLEAELAMERLESRLIGDMSVALSAPVAPPPAPVNAPPVAAPAPAL